MIRRKRNRRRGIVLLIVLSLLVVFLMMLVAFLLVASQYQRSAQSFARYQRDDSTNPKDLADGVMYQFLRDTTSSRSALQGHSLLADLYGNDGLRGMVIDRQPIANGQFIKINYVEDVQPARLFEGRTLDPRDDYYNGRVLTVTDSLWHRGPDKILGNADDRLMTNHAW